MILVAGLAVAGLVGIAAAFYFSIRTGKSGYKRNSGLPANNSRTANGGHSANAGRGATRASRNYRAEAHTGPNDVVDSGQEPGLVSGPAPVGRRAQAEVPTVAIPAYRAAPDAGSTNTPQDAPAPLSAFGPPAARPGSRSAARLARASHAAVVSETSEDPAKGAKSRRRVGWRKGSDIDEEMWPTEAFGGLSDDQFWDDLASDKPLQRTARTAHQDSGAKHRPLEAVPPTDPSRGNGRRTAPAAGNTSGYPGARPRPADRIAAPPVPSATQPVPSMGGTQPIPADLRPAAQFPPGASQPMRAATQSGEARGRRHAGASEDPLTSAAFSLRASGPVDGRSNQAPSGPREVSREKYNVAAPEETQIFNTVDGEAAGGGYAGGVPPFRPAGLPAGASGARAQRSGGGWSGDASRPAETYSGSSAYLYPGRPSSERRSPRDSQPYGGSRSRSEAGADAGPPSAASTPSYGDSYGNGPRRPARQGPRPGYQGPALPAEGQRRPRDPRDDYRRLLAERLSSPAD